MLLRRQKTLEVLKRLCLLLRVVSLLSLLNLLLVAFLRRRRGGVPAGPGGSPAATAPVNTFQMPDQVPGPVGARPILVTEHFMLGAENLPA